MTFYIERTLEPVLKKAANEFPAVVLTGPRQAGKTTLLKHLFSKTHQYLSLEPPDIRAAAISDPRGFINLYEAPIIFDEIQYAPELLFYIKEKIDEDRAKAGQYILTGSQNILLLEQVTESLAGRTAILRLLPLSYPEIIQDPKRTFPWENRKKEPQAPFPIKAFWNQMLRGSFPELTQNEARDSFLWQSSYIQTYLERDIRAVRQVGDLTQFQLFLKAVAARSGQLFQISDVASSIGISVNTAKAWLGVLEATYQIIILRPYFTNINKRLVKTPKVYFTDVGILTYLLGVKTIDHLISGPSAGGVVETYVFSEIYKRISNLGEDPRLYFWRTSTGSEVDLVLETESGLIPIEIKASSTPKSQMAEGIVQFQKDLKGKSKAGYVIHLGDIALPLSQDVLALPFQNL